MNNVMQKRVKQLFIYGMNIDMYKGNNSPFDHCHDSQYLDTKSLGLPDQLQMVPN